MTAAITTISSPGNVAGAAGIGATIATLSHTTQVTQKGVYRCKAYAVVGAAPGAADTNNIVVSTGSTTVTLPIQPVAGSSIQPVEFNATLDGATDIVAKVGASNNVAPYSVLLTAEYAGPMGGLRR